MKRDNWEVTAGEAMSAGGDPKCFYCKAPVGAQHGAGCTHRKRTVVVRASFEYTIVVGEDWSPETIHYMRNDHAAECFHQELVSLLAHRHAQASHNQHDDVSCLCTQVEYEYEREASPFDEARSNVFVADVGKEGNSR